MIVAEKLKFFPNNYYAREFYFFFKCVAQNGEFIDIVSDAKYSGIIFLLKEKKYHKLFHGLCKSMFLKQVCNNKTTC